MSQRVSLVELPIGAGGRVAALGDDARLDQREADWLRAVGLFEGAQVRVLRHAPFGGPLHLRTASGAEFAIDRQLARGVAIERDEVLTS